jgi:hypothetical protein
MLLKDNQRYIICPLPSFSFEYLLLGQKGAYYEI